MGQTLTHGIYLPDEGERNCYNGLASNWSILDGAVGTIAEHTSALSGKAPLVHTHTKSDITDLLNSNFIPSANNSYDLGSSSYQWNNLYAKNYYYNGTPWGLDKANEWTGENTFKTTVTYNGNFACYWKRANLTVGTLPSTTMYYGATRYADSAGTTITLSRGLVDTSGKNYFRQYTFAFSDTSKFCSIGSGIDADGSGSYFAFNAESVIPNDNNTTNLGTSTNKWKTLNGVNPGALSLPGTGGYTDIKGDITNLSGGNNTFTAPYDGWVCIKSTNATAIHIINTLWAVSQSATQSTAGTLCCLCPVMSGQSFNVIVNATSLEYAYIHPCKGNV